MLAREEFFADLRQAVVDIDEKLDPTGNLAGVERDVSELAADLQLLQASLLDSEQIARPPPASTPPPPSTPPPM